MGSDQGVYLRVQGYLRSHTLAGSAPAHKVVPRFAGQLGNDIFLNSCHNDFRGMFLDSPSKPFRRLFMPRTRSHSSRDAGSRIFTAILGTESLRLARATLGAQLVLRRELRNTSAS